MIKQIIRRLKLLKQQMSASKRMYNSDSNSPQTKSASGDTIYLRDTKFMISCAARTGSTFLVHLLRTNKDILCHGEVLDMNFLGSIIGHYNQSRRNTPGYEKFLDRLMREQPIRFLYDYVFDSQNKKVVGFKFKTDELFDPSYQAYSDIIFNDTDIKILHLRRRNLLDQFISHEVVKYQTGVTLIQQGDDLPDVTPFSVSESRVLKYFNDVISREMASLDHYKNHRILYVDYEDLAKPEHPVRNDIQRFLGVTPVTLESSTVKIIKNNRALVNNIDQIETFLINNGYQNRI